MNYYELLDVPVNATTDEIKQHYRKYTRINTNNHHVSRLDHINKPMNEYCTSRLYHNVHRHQGHPTERLDC